MRFWHGFVAAIVAIEALALVVVRTSIAPAVMRMIGDFGGEVSALHRLVTSSAWSMAWVAVLLATTIVLVRLVGDSKRCLVGLVVTAMVGAGVVAVTLAGLYGPIFEVTDRIQ